MSNVISRPKGSTLRLIADTDLDLTGYTVTSQLKDCFGVLKGTFEITLSTNPETTLLGRLTMILETATLEVGDYLFDIKFVSTSNEITYSDTCKVLITNSITQ